MKIRTLEDLEDRLYSEFAWRRDELRVIAEDFDQSNAEPPLARTRAAIAVLYAHWEGGVKAMGDAYISYIRNQAIRYRELPSGILALLLRAQLNELEESSRFARNRAICQNILRQLNEIAKFPSSLSIDTGSNLNSERLVDILAGIGIEEDLLATKHVLIDNLVDLRNRAAHGERVGIDADDFRRFYQPIVDALELLRDRLIQGAQQGHFVHTIPYP